MKSLYVRWIALAAFAGFLSASLPAIAAEKADKGGAGKGPEAQIEAMAKELNLTADQKEKLKPVLTKQGEKMRALRDDTTLTQEQRRAKMKTIRDETNPEVKKILTPEQYTKWETMRSQAQGKGKAKGEGKNK